MSNESSNNNGKIIIGILVVALVGSWIYFSTSKTEIVNNYTTQLNTADSTKNAIQAEFIAASAKVDSLTAQNGQLQGDLLEKSQNLQKLKSDIGALLTKKNATDKELEEATENFESISKLKNIKSNKNNQKLLNQYTTVLNKVKKEVDVLEKVYKKIKQEIKEKTQTFIQSYVEYDNVNYYNLVNGFIDTSYNVQCIYYLLTKEHQNIIKNVYEKTIIKEPLDMFEYLSRNFTPSFNIDKNTIVYYWDTDNKEHKMYSNFFDENNKNHTLINILPFNKKANKLFELITT